VDRVSRVEVRRDTIGSRSEPIAERVGELGPLGSRAAAGRQDERRKKERGAG
jgi:hypothetical protein